MKETVTLSHAKNVCGSGLKGFSLLKHHVTYITLVYIYSTKPILMHLNYSNLLVLWQKGSALIIVLKLWYSLVLKLRPISVYEPKFRFTHLTYSNPLVLWLKGSAPYCTYMLWYYSLVSKLAKSNLSFCPISVSETNLNMFQYYKIKEFIAWALTITY